MGIDVNAPIFVISVAAELAEMHPQTLRQYDRLGIVRPSRAPGRSRRYSQRDIELLREVQKLSQEGVSLEGIKRIMELQNQVTGLRQRIVELSSELDEAQRRTPDRSRVFAAGLAGDVVTLSRGQRPPAEPGPRDYSPEEDESDGSFVPDEPPPVGSGEPLVILAWLGAAGGPLLLLLFAMFWRGAPMPVVLGIVAIFVTCAGYLLFRLPQSRDEGDDGAAV